MKIMQGRVVRLPDGREDKDANGMRCLDCGNLVCGK